MDAMLRRQAIQAIQAVRPSGPLAQQTEFEYDDTSRLKTVKAGNLSATYTREAKAHHDFPWAQRVWFASRGIDVNNPAFGRWVSEIDHKFWHERAVPKFNDFWAEFRELERVRVRQGGDPYSIDEILQKLSECRAQYPVTQGFDP